MGADERPLSAPANLPFEIPTNLPHSLLLLSDSALPLGSFAFSSGLESYLAHRPPRPLILPFLSASLAAHAGSTLPFVLAAFRDPADLPALDDVLDASLPCPVTRRASLAQGRALLAVWERALRPAAGPTRGLDAPPAAPAATAVDVLAQLSATLKAAPPLSHDDDDDDDDDDDGSGVEAAAPAHGHFAPVWGLVCRLQGLGLADAAYAYLFGHARAVLSAAVRGAALGPFQAQAVLAGPGLQAQIRAAMRRWWDVPVDRAVQTAPPVDLWAGRHELLYTRIFNS